MSCPEFEERIALYAGGDLALEDVRRIEDHLRSCPACAELARLLEHDRASLATQPPEAASVDYAAMRLQIRRRITQRSRARKLLPALLAAASVLLMLRVAMLRRQPKPVAPPPQIAKVEQPVQQAQVPPVLPARAKPRRIAKQRPQLTQQPGLTLEAAMRMLEDLESPPPPAGSDSPVEIRIATRDPNVTIVLLPETKGDFQ
ncbi:MAG TPA: anti-sigma factor [Bryobacteraceae bacterium]|nr:anti-sigma factor [Bryobacteraceae bacterium]